MICFVCFWCFLGSIEQLAKHALAGDSVVYLSENVFFSYVPFDPEV